MISTNQTILEQGNAAIAEGNHEGFLALCTEDTEWNFIGDQILKGKQAVREYMAKTYIVPPSVTVEQFIAQEDMLTVTGEITLTDAKDRETQYWYCDIWRFEDGKMAELKAFVIEKKD